MSGENPAPRDVSQDEVDAALAAAGAPQPEAKASESPSATPAPSAGPPDAASGAAEPASVPETVTVGDVAASAELHSTDAIPLDLPDLSTIGVAKKAQGIELLTDVELNVKIELGRATMPIEEVLRLGEGSVVELDKLAGDPVDVLVNDRLVARGEVIVLNDNFCVRISEIVAIDSDVAAA